MGPAQHHLLPPVLDLCWNALGLRSEFLARRHHYYRPEIRNAHCRRRARPHRSPITVEVWTCLGTWFWYVVNPQRNGGTIGAAATEMEALDEARSSIEEMSARRADVAAPHLAGRRDQGI
jgi:hypothetical protein